MKICMLVANSVVYDGRTKKQVSSLARHGHSVEIIGIHDPGLPYAEVGTPGILMRRISVWSRRLPKSRFLFPLKFAEYALRLLIRAVESKADAYQCSAMELLLIGWIVSGLNRARLVYDCREIVTEAMVYQWLPRQVRHMMRVYEQAFARRAYAVLNVDPQRADILADWFNLQDQVIVGNYPELRPASRNGTIRRRANIGDDTPIILYQGILRMDRGISEVMQALRLVRQAHFVAMGYGPDRERFSREAESLGISHRVSFLDPVDPSELLEYAAGADIGVITLHNTCVNNYYAAPGKLYDYLMAGLPVIVSDFPGLKAVVEQGRCGAAVDPRDPQAIASAIETIISDKGTWTRMSQGARRLAETQYNWSVAEQGLLRVYGDLRREQ